MSTEPYDPWRPQDDSSSTPSGRPSRGGNKAAAVRAQLDDTMDAMRSNIQVIASRGETLDSLQEKTDNLVEQSTAFKKTAKQVRKRLWWKDVKMRIIIGVTIAVVVGLIIFSIVGAIRKSQHANQHNDAPAPATSSSSSASSSSTAAPSETSSQAESSSSSEPTATSSALDIAAPSESAAPAHEARDWLVRDLVDEEFMARDLWDDDDEWY